MVNGGRGFMADGKIFENYIVIMAGITLEKLCPGAVIEVKYM